MCAFFNITLCFVHIEPYNMGNHKKSNTTFLYKINTSDPINMERLITK